MNLLLVTYEPQPSGQTTHLLSLVRGLDPHRYRLTVVVPESLAAGIAALRRQPGVEIIPLQMGKIAWPPRSAWALVQIIRQRRFDAVHIHSQEAGLVARPLARLAGAKALVYTPQTIDIRQVRWQRLYQSAERVLAQVTTAVIAVNEADRRRLVDWGLPAQKVATIPNGIDLSAFSQRPDPAALRAELGLDPRRPVVMQVGRLSAQKDPLAFVEGAARVVREQPQVQFALVGDGPLRPAVAARVQELGLGEQLRILGRRESGWRLLAAADMATLTSHWEGSPYALLEAMAWSRPVVATAVNGCAEVVADGETGLLVPPGDPPSWAAAVLALLADPARANAMGERGRRRVEERFSQQQMIERLEALYRQALELQP